MTPIRQGGEDIASIRHARRHRVAWRVGMLASVLIHVLVVVLWRTTPIPAPSAAAGRDPARPVPGGGGALAAVAIRVPTVTEIPPPPRPVLAVDMPQVEVREFAAPVAGPVVAPVSEVALVPGIGGIGGGEGGGSGTGEDGFVPPVPRSVIPHWDPPESVRGLEVTVRVYVDANGRPTGEVELDPPTPDRGFNREIIERVHHMEYRPASRNGRPVSGWAEITFIF